MAAASEVVTPRREVVPVDDCVVWGVVTSPGDLAGNVDLSVGAAPASNRVRWSDLQPTGLLMDVLQSLAVEHLDAAEVLEAATALERLVAVVQGVQARMLARFGALRPGDDREVSEFAADEVAPALRVSRGAAAARLGLAVDLQRRLPATLAALCRGELDLAKARVISEAVASLTDSQAGVVEQAVLPRAAEQTAPALRAAARRAVLKVDPAAAQRREALARADRRVVCTPTGDGMAELYALLPAADAVAVYDRVNRLARSLPGDERSMDHRRADCFTDLMLGSGRQVTARVNVTVAATTLLGRDDQPGHLDGYGPVTADTARHIAGGALTGDTVWRRLLTDPVDGTVVAVGRRRYRPSAALADQVRARDRSCRFPGCRYRADGCDLDHTVPFPTGPTVGTNLGTLCRHHHRLKHETDWAVSQDPHGRFAWRSPTGRRYVTEPPSDPP